MAAIVSALLIVAFYQYFSSVLVAYRLFSHHVDLFGSSLPTLPRTPTQQDGIAPPLTWRALIPYLLDSPPFLQPTRSFIYPSSFGIFISGCVLLWPWFYNMAISLQGYSQSSWIKRTRKLILPHRKLSTADEFHYDPPPEKWNRKARNSSPPPSPSRLKLLSVFALLCGTLVDPTQGISLRSENQFGNHLRKYRAYNGSLDTSKLTPHDLSVLQRHLRDKTQLLHQLTDHNPNAFTCIVDSGCSYSATNTFSDVDPKSIRRLSNPILLGGIAGGLTIEFVGQATWETLDNDGNLFSITDSVLIHPDLPHRLLSPQSFLSQGRKNRNTINIPDAGQDWHGDDDDHFRVYHNRAEFHKQGKQRITMDFDSSHLPRMILFSKNQAIPALEAMAGVLNPSNTNLSTLQKLWMQLHVKLGHISWSHVQKLGIGGSLGLMPMKLSDAKPVELPLCSACQYGKQTRTPDNTTTTIKNPDKMGGLKRDQTTPGATIFCDHLESHVKGRLLHTAGREPDSSRYRGSMIFCDSASGLIHVEHQVSLGASDTIIAKENFERLALQHGVIVDSYHTDNGTFKSNRFVEEIKSNVQSIRYSGVGAKWQNGTAEGGIRIIVSKARTMMIHAALHWPEAEDDSLWPLAVNHAVYLYNHTPNEITGIAPMEIFSRTISDGQALRNLHPWGCPTYVLAPRLTDAGGKIPKWQPRSRRAQFVGISPLHAESIGLVRNLTTGYISPQYHLVYDDWFQTVQSSSDVPPPEWNDLCTFQRHEIFFDDTDQLPLLSDEWLTPEEVTVNKAKRRTMQLRQGRKLLWQDLNNKESRDDFNYQAPEPDDAQTREQSFASPREQSFASPREQSSASPREPLNPSWTRDTPIMPSPSAPPREPPPRESAPLPTPTDDGSRPTRTHKPISRLNMNPKLKTYAPSSLVASIIDQHGGGLTPASGYLLQSQIHGYDPFTGFQESLHPATIQSPLALKAKASKDPDLPSLRESLNGPHAENFWLSMDKEISSLEGKGTWKVVDRSSIPPGTKTVPGTWVQRIKRLPNGLLNKFKSRWCCRGDLQDYDGVAYSPLVGWPTVRAGLLLAAAHGWKSRCVDFTLAFCQSPQPEDNPLYMELPQYYRPTGFEGRDVVLKMEKSIYGQVDSPKLFYEHLSRGMRKLGFEPSESDPCLFIHKTLQIMVLNYCDDQIWLSPDNDLIETYVAKLAAEGYDLILEEEGDIFDFLGINFKTDGSNIELTQTGLIEKVIDYTMMGNASEKSTPAAQEPLGSDLDGELFSEEWQYSAAVGMLLYLSSNTRPDIQFAVHQVARFSHAPRKSHGQAIKRIIRYLIATRNRGILFKPNLDEGLDCYVDADFCGLYGHEDEQDPVSVKSRTGFVLTLFGCPIIWSSKLQTDITLSSTAAEYVAFSMAMRELLPMRVLLQEIGAKMNLPAITKSMVRSTVFEDNQGCLSLVNVPKMSARNKYLSLKYHFFRNEIGEEKGIVAVYVNTLEQKADIFTKGLPPAQFAVIRKLLMGW